MGELSPVVPISVEPYLGGTWWECISYSNSPCTFCCPKHLGLFILNLVGNWLFSIYHSLFTYINIRRFISSPHKAFYKVKDGVY